MRSDGWRRGRWRGSLRTSVILKTPSCTYVLLLWPREYPMRPKTACRQRHTQSNVGTVTAIRTPRHLDAVRGVWLRQVTPERQSWLRTSYVFAHPITTHKHGVRYSDEYQKHSERHQQNCNFIWPAQDTLAAGSSACQTLRACPRPRRRRGRQTHLRPSEAS
jgi:hypothetical protein